MTQLTVSLIVHDDFSHIATALDSLYTGTGQPIDVHLTINAGTPEAIDAIRRRFPHVTLHVNPMPRGFAANHNAILNRALTPYVALLNDDILMPEGGLDALVRHLETHPQVGLVGPLIQNPDGTPQSSAFSDPSLARMLYAVSGLGRFTRPNGPARRVLERLGLARRLGIMSVTSPEPHAVPVIVGVAMVARRAACLEAGVMDETTRFYGEEFGWHLRLRRRGWQVVLVPSVRVTHFNTAQSFAGWKLAEHRRSILAYFSRYKPRWQTLVLRGAILTIHGLKALLLLPFSRAAAADHRAAARTATLRF